MKALFLNKPGIENINAVEISEPSINDNEVLVKVGSVSLNYLDLAIAKGFFSVPYPYVLGCDAAGVVKAVGKNVTTIKAGDRVTTVHMPLWERGNIREEYVRLENRIIGGAFAEYIALPEKSVVRFPDQLTEAEAATLPIAGVTAWEALFNVGKIRAGDDVLLLGTGGVSIFALKYAKAAGANVIITSSSDEKLELAKSLGANHVINYKKIPDWSTKVLSLTHGAGVHVALDVVGSQLDQTVRCVKVDGYAVVIGIVGGVSVNISVFDLLQRPLSIRAIEVGSKETFVQMNKAIELNSIKPVIGKEFHRSEIQNAFHFMDKGEHFGKIVVNF